MARHASGVRINADELLTIDEPLDLVGIVVEGEARSRRDAIACYLSGGDGWHEAAKLLRGTFADGTTERRERETTNFVVNQRVSESFQRPGVKDRPVPMIKQV